MIIKRKVFSSDVLTLSDKDIAALKEGKTLTVAGLEVKHVSKPYLSAVKAVHNFNDAVSKLVAPKGKCNHEL
mgnify:CR=1 FL=1